MLHNDNEIIESIKSLCPAIKDIQVQEEPISYDKLIRLKLDTSNDLICDATDCFIQSKEGKECLDKYSFIFIPEHEYFQKSVSKYTGTKDTLTDIVTIIGTMATIVEIDPDDYFSNSERNEIQDKIRTLLIGEF